MSYKYHQGETTLQQHLGVGQAAARLTPLVHNFIAEGAQAFILSQHFFLLCTTDKKNNCYTSLVQYNSNSIAVINDTKLSIDINSAYIDTLTIENILETGKIATLFIDFQTARRFRINGDSAQITNNRIVFDVQEGYPNCTKYIDRAYKINRKPGLTAQTSYSTPKKYHWDCLLASNTIFLGSINSHGLPDVSHRGFLKGSIQRDGEKNIILPNYSGNNMYNTFGNLLVTPNISLLVYDDAQGIDLCFTGTAELIDENPPIFSQLLSPADLAKINLYLRISIDQCIEKKPDNSQSNP